MSSGLRPLTASSSASAGNSPASRSTTSSGGPPGAGASSPPSLGRLVCMLIKGVLSGPATGSEPPLALRASRRFRPGSTSQVGHPDLTQNIGQNLQADRLADPQPGAGQQPDQRLERR